MGGDGGVIAAQRKFIRGTKDITDNNDKLQHSIYNQENQKNRSKMCSLSNEKLIEPICMDELGNLYNKEAILKYLLSQSKTTSTAPMELTIENNGNTFGHIRTLKDVCTVEFTKNTNVDDEKSATSNTSISNYICPITLIEFNGLTRFCAVWFYENIQNQISNKNKRGVVISEKGLKLINNQTNLTSSKRNEDNELNAHNNGIAKYIQETYQLKEVPCIYDVDIVPLLPYSFDDIKTQKKLLHDRRQLYRDLKAQHISKNKLQTNAIEKPSGKSTIRSSMAEDESASHPAKKLKREIQTHPSTNNSNTVINTHSSLVVPNSLHTSSSSVYRNIFHKTESHTHAKNNKNDKKTLQNSNSNDLFIATSGLRYSIT